MTDHDPSADELARRLSHAARLAGVGKVASSAAHELNQPLNVIRMAAFNIRRAIQKGTLNPESAIDKLEKIDAQIDRAARLVGGMKAFSPTASAMKTTVKPSEAVHVALELLAKRFSAGSIELEHQVLETPCEMQANPAALQELMINLVDNAIEAYGEAPSGIPEEGAEEPPPRKIVVSEALDGPKFALTITDYAGGIDSSMADSLFEPFVTSATDGSHPGLGLTVCRDIAEDLGGSVSLKPIEGGTEVVVTFPVDEAPPI